MRKLLAILFVPIWGPIYVLGQIMEMMYAPLPGGESEERNIERPTERR